ncbi:MAG: flagellar hook-basal body complex protein FliE [Candidatus Limnocylindrales bacterium]
MTAIGPIPGITSVLGGAGAAGVSGAGAQASPIGATAAQLTGAPTGADATSPGNSFLDAIGNALGQLNAQVNGADASMAQFAAGGSADLHTVMLDLQQASIGLKTGIAVRDKLLEAYQELMRIQV